MSGPYSLPGGYLLPLYRHRLLPLRCRLCFHWTTTPDRPAGEACPDPDKKGFRPRSTYDEWGGGSLPRFRQHRNGTYPNTATGVRYWFIKCK
jgi:hypothetical protein